jgi:hypothetical protein
MRMLARNMQKLKCSLEDGTWTVYEYDANGNPKVAYVTEEGTPIYVQTETVKWTLPVEFFASISLSGGEAEAKEFGLSISDYDAVVVVANGAVALNIGSRIWHTSEVKYQDLEQTIVDEKSADYIVVKVSKSLNFTKYVLRAVVK